MCGIVGYITAEKHKGADARARYVAQGLIVDMLRGADSTGAYFVNHDNKVGTVPGFVRDTVDGFSFVNNNEAFAQRVRQKHHAVIGHNRAATIGGIAIGATHPFREGAITLVHNGTIRATSGLPKSQAELEAYNDSHTICHNLNDTPITELAGMLNGSYALVWHDSRDNTMNIVRNNTRPLHLLKLKDENTLLLASEAEMAYWLCSRPGIKKDIEKVMTPAPGQWLRFPHGSIEPEVEKVNLWSDNWRSSKSTAPTHPYNWRGHVEDADWEPVNPVSRKARGKSPLPNPTRGIGVAEQDNRVKLLGKKMEVPMLAQEALLDLGFVVEDRVEFVPVRSAGLPEAPAVVSGYIPGKEGITGIIHGVPPAITKYKLDNVWVARPVAVKVLDSKEKAVILKLVATDSTSGRGKEILSTSQTGKPPTDDDGADTKEDDSPFVRGPRGEYIPLATYLQWTSSGCIHCTGPIHEIDAEELVWVNNSHDPMCPDCVSDWFGDLKEDSGYAN